MFQLDLIQKGLDYIMSSSQKRQKRSSPVILVDQQQNLAQKQSFCLEQKTLLRTRSLHRKGEY